LPNLSTASYDVVRHSKANAKGVKSERPNLRSVPRRAFTKLDNVEDLVMALFGPRKAP
jgi:hypothetical protein